MQFCHKQKYRFLMCLSFLTGFVSTGFSNDGDSTFNSLRILDIQINFWQPNFWDSLLATHSNDTTMVCNVNIEGTQLDSVGIKIKGNSSFNSYPGNKKSLKIEFDQYVDTLRFDGLKVINLNNCFKDPTLVREKIMLDFLRATGIPGPRANFAKVTINGTYWGLYSLVEQVDKIFLNDLIGNKDGNLFKGDPQGSLQWFGPTDSSYYSKYELKTNDSLNDWTDLVRLINIINNTPASDFQDSLEGVLNTNNFVGQWASSILFSNLDSYYGSGHNYYIYHNTANNKFEWITWDVNEAFGNFNMGMGLTQIKELSCLFLPNPPNGRPLVKKMLDHPVYKEQYIQTICGFLYQYFNEEVMFETIDSLTDFIRTAVYADTQKMYTNIEFETNIHTDIVSGGPGGSIPGLKSFVTVRIARLAEELDSLGCVLPGVLTPASEKLNLVLFPNPTTGEFRILNGRNTFGQIEMFDVTGRKCWEQSLSADFSVSPSSLSQGIYLVKIIENNRPVTYTKIIIQP